MELLTARLVLRDFRLEDYEALRALESHPETYHFEGPNPSPEKTQQKLEKIRAQNMEQPRQYYWLAVTLSPDNRLIGRISLVLLNNPIHEWEIGWAIHPDEWGQGYAPEAARRLLDFAFTELGVHRVTAFCHIHNRASVRVMEKLSMQREGHLRETRWWREAWSDELVHAILEREWKSVNGSN